MPKPNMFPHPMQLATRLANDVFMQFHRNGTTDFPAYGTAYLDVQARDSANSSWAKAWRVSGRSDKVGVALERYGREAAENAALIVRYNGGQEHVFDVLHCRWMPMARAIIYRYLGYFDEDVAQNAFIK